MEELKIKIIQILDQFQKEEFGNRLSQFSLVGLKMTILNQIEKFKDEDGKGNPSH